MLTEFAHGHSAVVYYNNKEGLRPPFSRADLVRVEQCLGPEYGAFVFCQMQLVQMAFPGHFPEVIAYRVRKDDPKSFVERGGILSYEPSYYLYSNRTATPSDHNVFCDHIANDLEGYKIHTCPCATCSAHALIHEESHSAMHTFVKTALQAGIELPYDDPTDWCLGSNGNIVFFEINRLHVNPFSDFIARQELNPDQRAKVNRLVRAYQKVEREMSR